MAGRAAVFGVDYAAGKTQCQTTGGIYDMLYANEAEPKTCQTQTALRRTPEDRHALQGSD